jgi:AcrR family transcriptional regulator
MKRSASPLMRLVLLKRKIQMARSLATKIRSAARAAGRCGRPPRDLAAGVDERILEAARKVFLERGFEGASVEEIAEAARSGKPTIYARYPNKKALFAAAYTSALAARTARLASHMPAGETLEERLTSLGEALLCEVLTGEWIGLIRLAIAEARRFPDLGSSVIKITRERGRETIAQLLCEVARAEEPGTVPEFNPDHCAAAAQYFCELMLLPVLMRALSGEDLKVLHGEIGPYVSQRVAFFLAACRHSGLG